MTNLILPILSLALMVLCQGAYYEDSFTKFREEIGKKTNKWQPGYNKRFQGLSEQEMIGLLGAKYDKLEETPKKWILTRSALPDTFDAREHWKICNDSIGFIRDQSRCGSCWAVSSSEVMSDRICIKSNGTEKRYMSEEDILSCCTNCGYYCDAGYVNMAFEFWLNFGVVTGGPFGSKTGCRPYTISATNDTTPACIHECQPSYNIPYDQDKRKGSKYYNIQGGAEAMKQEIYENGPIVGIFDVYEDFFHYNGGIYHHVAGNRSGGHAVKVIGWGSESNTPYWLVVNSWNETWGDQGLFKIQRGTNECGFETWPITALP